LVTNNSRFLILPDWHHPNLASRILSLSQKRLCRDWLQIFGHPILLMETFVDPQYFHGTVYRAANWIYVGATKGFHRTRQGYSNTAQSPKMVFVKPLKANARELLSGPTLPSLYHTGGNKIMLSANQMESLPDFFRKIPDPRRGQGRRHSLPTINKKTGKPSKDIAYGITSRTSEQADPERVLNANRFHWSIENSCHHIIDWNYDEDRSRISKGYGPENVTRFRRFAISIIKSKGVRSVAQKMRELTRNTRLVFDYLKMTKNSCAASTALK
jgi:hypothetical protein